VCLQLVERCERQPGQMLVLIGDKNFRGKDFEAELANLDARIMRPRCKDEPGRGPTSPRSVNASSASLRVRLLTRFAALTAAIALNHRLGRPSRSLANYTA
jgi:hypothetical protein